MNFSQGHSGTKVRDVSFVLVFPRKKTPEFTQKWAKLLVLAFSLVGFAGAIADLRELQEHGKQRESEQNICH